MDTVDWKVLADNVAHQLVFCVDQQGWVYGSRPAGSGRRCARATLMHFASQSKEYNIESEETPTYARTTGRVLSRMLNISLFRILHPQSSAESLTIFERELRVRAESAIPVWLINLVATAIIHFGLGGRGVVDQHPFVLALAAAVAYQFTDLQEFRDMAVDATQRYLAVSPPPLAPGSISDACFSRDMIQIAVLLIEVGTLAREERFVVEGKGATDSILRLYEATRGRESCSRFIRDNHSRLTCCSLFLRAYDLTADPRILNAMLKLLEEQSSARVPFAMDAVHRTESGGINADSPREPSLDLTTLHFLHRRVRAHLDDIESGRVRPTSRVPQSLDTILPPAPDRLGFAGVGHRVVVLTAVESASAARLCRALTDASIHVCAVIAMRSPYGEWGQHLGSPEALEAWYPSTPRCCTDEFYSPPERVLDWARSHQVAYIECESPRSEEVEEAIRSSDAELGLLTGVGMIPARLCRVPRFGMINAHNGLLPWYRGMDAVAWAFYHGDPVGCSVHWVEPGVDTGAVLSRCEVTVADRSQHLRAAVKDQQIALLVRTTQAIFDSAIPSRSDPTPPAFPQFFRMHWCLRALVESLQERRHGNDPTTSANYL